MQNNPQVIFERLFGDGSTDAERRDRRGQSLSLLDSVMGEAAALNKVLPAGDRNRVDQYLSDAREIERRIEKAGQQVSADLNVPAAPAGIPKDFEEHMKLMFDLWVLAWQADITRITTLLMAKELSNAVYAKSGVRDAFHILSHHSNLQENMDRLGFALTGRFLQNVVRIAAAIPTIAVTLGVEPQVQPASPDTSALSAGIARST